MTQEAERQRGMPTNPAESRAQGSAEGIQIGCAVIRKFSGLDVAPQGFDGVQFGSIGRQAFDREPGPLPRQVGAHPSTGVSAKPIPQQDDPMAAEVALQGAEKWQERRGRVGTWPGLEVQPGAAAVPAKGEGGGHGQPLPAVADMGQDGSLPAWRPGPPDDRLLGESAFVLEDEPGAPATGVFFTAGHRTRTHRRIAVSSRSTAWRAGRWSDQFRRCRIRQT
jgi:hypothetical protein